MDKCPDAGYCRIMSDTIKELTIEGYRSIRKLEKFKLRSLNVLIGANGAGKSNFVSFFRLLREMAEQRLQIHVQTNEGGADACLYMGPKVTDRFAAKICLDENSYKFVLKPTVENQFVFTGDDTLFQRDGYVHELKFGYGHMEALLKNHATESGADTGPGTPFQVYSAISRLVVYHFHDSSLTAGVRRQRPINDDEMLRPDAENLAAYLFRITQTHPRIYTRIRDIVQLAAPFLDDFKLRPFPRNPELIQLEWLQTGSDRPFLAHQLSDGTLRFICLVTALLQPDRPATMIFDEPELGLHPYAVELLGDLFKQASSDANRQIVISTQSAELVNEFEPEDIVVVDRHAGESVFRRLAAKPLEGWLEEYSLGQLWRKNAFGGRPQPEQTPQFAPDGDIGS